MPAASRAIMSLGHFLSLLLFLLNQTAFAFDRFPSFREYVSFDCAGPIEDADCFDMQWNRYQNSRFSDSELNAFFESGQVDKLLAVALTANVDSPMFTESIRLALSIAPKDKLAIFTAVNECSFSGRNRQQ